MIDLVTEDQRARLESAVRGAMEDMLAGLEAGGMTRAQAVRAVVDAVLRGPPNTTSACATTAVIPGVMMNSGAP